MSHTYYKVIATYEGIDEVLYGSFVRKDCLYEIESERESWKEQGYKKIRIEPELTEEEPDADVYASQLHLIH